LSHPYFDDLRDEGVVFPNGNLMPDLFNFTDLELMKASVEQKTTLVPMWYITKTSSAKLEKNAAAKLAKTVKSTK
jgi:hypothetical protein